MGFLLLLILIPLFSVGIVLYVVTLYEFAITGNFNELMLLISVLLSVITSYFIPKLFVNVLSKNTAKSLNNGNKILILSNYISIILLIVFGLVMLYRGILTLNVIQILVGVGCICIFVYSTYYHFFNFEIDDFTLNLLIDHKKYKELSFSNDVDFITCYTESDKFVEGNKYTLEYNKYTSVVKKINDKAIGGEKNEKNNKEKH